MPSIPLMVEYLLQKIDQAVGVGSADRM
jgi:hypothetical protein